LEWIEIFVETSQIGLELVSGLLYQYGLTGLMIEDGSDFEEFLQNPNREWDYIEDELVEQKQKQPTGITFFIRDNVYGREQLSDIKSALFSLKEQEKEFDLGTLKVVVKNIKEEDWANNWKKYFKPFAIGDKIIIKPSWEELEQTTEKIVLKIDPAHIFGTGTHETTQLCIEFIEEFVKKGDSVFDIGCGSGILSIASLLLGAENADAIDIDINAVDVAYENAKRNDIDKKRYCVVAGNILNDETLHKTYSSKKYDVVEANIVADVIIALSEQVPYYIKKQGTFICSGIIKQREQDVKIALEKNRFTIIDIKYKKDWVAIVSRYDG
jgi:ribosomal protein L11 methyltransferase